MKIKRTGRVAIRPGERAASGEINSASNSKIAQGPSESQRLRIPDRTISFCPIGGLANQLYQAAAMFGFSRRNDIESVCEV